MVEVSQVAMSVNDPVPASFSNVAVAGKTGNTPYVVSGSGASVSLTVAGGQKEMVYPSDGSNVNFVAYYPYQADTHTTAKANVYKANVSNQSSAKAIDLLYHKGTGTAYNRDRSGSVTLAFTHQLSKLKIDLIPASGVEPGLTGAALTLSGFPATADFNLSTGVLGNVGGTTGTLTPVKVSSSPGGAAFEAIVIPHGGAGTSYTRNVKFTINGTSYSYALPASGTFKAGTAHSYPFKFTGANVEPATEIVNNPYGDGGTVSWGAYRLIAGKLAFELPASRTMYYNAVTLSTNAPSALAVSLSGEADRQTTDVPAWITGVSLSDAVTDDSGWNSYTLTFGTDYNVNPEAAPRTGYIRLEADGLSLPVRVTQTAQAYTTGEPVPASFADVVAGGVTGNRFTITTNTPDEAITVTTTNTQMITNLTQQRGEVADNGSSTWTVTFDVSGNTTTSARSGNIEVTIGGQTKTIQVSQTGKAIYVLEPVPASFHNVAVAGKTGNTFTITTNAPDEDITVTTTNASMITNLTQQRGAVADDGSSTWTIGFDVTTNTTSSGRSGQIEVTVSGQKKTIFVSQGATGLYINDPVPASFTDVVAGGATGNTFTLETNSTDMFPILNTTDALMITNLKSERAVKDAMNGVYTWTVTFDVSKNTYTYSRSGDIMVTVGGQTKTVSVSQVAMYVNEPVPASFQNVAVAGKTGNTFTITTNAPDEDITVTTTNTQMITNLTQQRGAVADDGSSTWTIGFDVSKNTYTYSRSGDITVTVGGQTKTVSVSQVAMYVNEPVPASFQNVAVAGATGNTFTITTNAPDEDITVTTTNTQMITNLTKVRGVVDADGSSTWTIGFDVTANTSISPREGNIEVTVGGQKKTFSGSQVAVDLYINDPVPASFADLPAAGKTGNTFTLETNSTDMFPILNTTDVLMITNLKSERAVKDATNGVYTWTVTFDVSANTYTYSRSGDIMVTVGGQTKTVQVSQVAMYVNEPVPASFTDLPAAGKTGNTFTITTNAPDEDITVTTTNTQMITNLTQQRGAVADDGSSTWTIGFDVTANTSTFYPSGYIKVTVGGREKTVEVSQVVMYVNDPVPASFTDLPAAGKTGNTFTITSNDPDENITMTTTSDWITNLTKVRGAVDADGSSTWTIGFDVTANTNNYSRSRNIEVIVNGQTKTVQVSQVAMYVNDPVPASFADLPAAGKTGNTFTITTNAPDEDITVTTTNASMITNLTKVRGAVDADGSSTWTIGFDVTANTNNYSRSRNIEVIVNRQKKTVEVSQVAMSVNDPVPASFANLPAAGKTGNTFTITTDAPVEDITVTATGYYFNMFTNLTKVR
ncbi:MAG: fimbrillin family protein, partial [Mediterranea sp.]|nr:fimbrillin family protein [Mediterranea sp.]